MSNSPTIISDFFGIGNAIRGAMNIYFRGARRSGRTTAMIERLQDGDRVVFLNAKEGERVQRLAKDAGKKIEVSVVRPDAIERILERKPIKGRTYFDHSWIEEYYLFEIERSIMKLQHFHACASGNMPDYGASIARNNLEKWEF